MQITVNIPVNYQKAGKAQINRNKPRQIDAAYFAADSACQNQFPSCKKPRSRDIILEIFWWFLPPFSAPRSTLLPLLVALHPQQSGKVVEDKNQGYQHEAQIPPRAFKTLFKPPRGSSFQLPPSTRLQTQDIFPAH